jgi:hypothetical protein
MLSVVSSLLASLSLALKQPLAGYGSADMVGWLVDERGIEAHPRAR